MDDPSRILDKINSETISSVLIYQKFTDWPIHISENIFDWHTEKVVVI